MEHPRPREDPVELTKGKWRNPACRFSAADRRCSTPFQRHEPPDNAAVQPVAGEGWKAPPRLGSPRSGPFEKGSSKNCAARLPSVELIASRDWNCHAKENQ